MPASALAIRYRAELAEIGERRKGLAAREKELQQDTKRVLRLATRVGGVPVAEAARLAGLNRSTVYELYLVRGDEDAPTNDRSGKGRRSPSVESAKTRRDQSG